MSGRLSDAAEHVQKLNEDYSTMYYGLRGLIYVQCYICEVWHHTHCQIMFLNSLDCLCQSCLSARKSI